MRRPGQEGAPSAAVEPADDVSQHPRGWLGSRRRRMAALFVAALIGATGVWVGLRVVPNAQSTALVGPKGQPAPAFSLSRLVGSAAPLKVASLRGRPLVINFWASWCTPCRKEMPLLEAAYRREHGQVQFLGIDSNDTPGDARAFLRQVHVTYQVVSDGNGAVADRYGLYGLPTTIFINPSGVVAGRHIGELHANTLVEALQEAFPNVPALRAATIGPHPAVAPSNRPRRA